jgi:phosphate transport system permease protein
MTIAILGALFLLAFIGFMLGQSHAPDLAGENRKSPHMRSICCGTYVALWSGLPALMLFVLWVAFEPYVLEPVIIGDLPASMIEDGPSPARPIFADIREIAIDGAGDRQIDPAMAAAVDHYRRLKSVSFAALAVAVLALATAGLAGAPARLASGARGADRVPFRPSRPDMKLTILEREQDAT